MQSDILKNYSQFGEMDKKNLKIKIQKIHVMKTLVEADFIFLIQLKYTKRQP